MKRHCIPRKWERFSREFVPEYTPDHARCRFSLVWGLGCRWRSVPVASEGAPRVVRPVQKDRERSKRNPGQGGSSITRCLPDEERSLRLMPPRLAANCEGNDPFAAVHDWSGSRNEVDRIRRWIDDAFSRRRRQPDPDNSYRLLAQTPRPCRRIFPRARACSGPSPRKRRQLAGGLSQRCTRMAKMSTKSGSNRRSGLPSGVELGL